MWESQTIVLDGGLATELEARGHDLSDALWSARLLRDAPEEIVAAHVAFFEAGADVAITASYQASFTGFAAHGIEPDDAAVLMERSVELADRARQRFTDGRRRWVAASVGPYGAVLADGSEYRGRYGLSPRRLRQLHQPRVEVLADAGPDLLALETIPDVDEAVGLLETVAEVGIPAWLTYTIDGDRTRAGQPLEEAFAALAGSDHLIAVGVNCCSPDDVVGAVVVAREVTGKPVIVYPNSGEAWAAESGTWSGGARFSGEVAAGWYDLGATAVGGCCRVRPTDIAVLARAAAARSA